MTPTTSSFYVDLDDGKIKLSSDPTLSENRARPLLTSAIKPGATQSDLMAQAKQARQGAALRQASTLISRRVSTDQRVALMEQQQRINALVSGGTLNEGQTAAAQTALASIQAIQGWVASVSAAARDLSSAVGQRSTLKEAYQPALIDSTGLFSAFPSKGVETALAECALVG